MKEFQGKVISDKMEKSAVVLVEHMWQHPLYKKRIRRSKKYLVHNDKDAKKGDKVLIQETRPISKRKHFKITKVLES